MFLTSTCTKKRECYHAHSLLRGSGKTLHQEQTITSTPICTSRTISVVIYISEDVYCTILFRGVKFSGFRKTKTSVNKRLFMSPLFPLSVPALRFNVSERTYFVAYALPLRCRLVIGGKMSY